MKKLTVALLPSEKARKRQDRIQLVWRTTVTGTLALFREISGLLLKQTPEFLHVFFPFSAVSLIGCLVSLPVLRSGSGFIFLSGLCRRTCVRTSTRP